MKVIKAIKEKYYPDVEDQEAIKGHKIHLSEMSYRLGITYMSFYRKLYNKDGQYFTRMEIDKLIKLTGIEFKYH